MEHTLQQFNLVQASGFTMDKGKPSLVAPTLTIMTRENLKPCPQYWNRENPHPKNFLILKMLMNCSKQLRKMLKGLKLK